MTGAFPLGIGVVFSAPTGSFAVTNTTVTDNQSGGIFVIPTGGTGIVVNAVLNGVSLYNNGLLGFAVNGANADLTSRVTATITNSVAGNNVGNGFWTITAAGQAPTTIVLTNSVATTNVVGLRAEGSLLSGILVGGSTLTSNGTNLIMATGGIVNTSGNNIQTLNLNTNPFNATVPLQ